MSNNLDPEQERLIRLREKQLSTRDPGIKKKKFTNMLSEKERRTKNSLSIGRVWSAIPHIWRWAFYGVVLGLITMAVLPTHWVHDKAWIVAIAAHRSIPWLRQLRCQGIAVAYAYTAPAKLPPSPLKRIIRRWALRELSRHLDCIIAGSAAMGRHARKLGSRSRIEVTPNGVDLKRFHPNRGNAQCHHLRASMGMSDQSIMIATVGSVIPGKGCDLILEAWAALAKRFPQAHFVIVGARFDPNHYQKGEFEKKIASLIASSGAGDRVHFTGHVDDIELYYRACDIFVFPTQKEGMPNVVLEAMASAVPVILTPFPTLSEDLGQPGREFLLIERQPEALASEVERLIRNTDLRQDLGRRGRWWVEQTMDLEHAFDRYAALYRELARR